MDRGSWQFLSRRGFTETREPTLSVPARTTPLISRNYSVKSRSECRATTNDGSIRDERTIETRNDATTACPCHLRRRRLIAGDTRSLIYRTGPLPSRMRDKRQLSGLARSARSARLRSAPIAITDTASKYHRRNDLRSIGTVDRAETADRRLDLDSSVSSPPLHRRFGTNDTPRLFR
jgi:hypothetical protein